MNDVERVPLPANLSTCGCPHAPKMHLVTCAAAIAHDDTPLDQRDGYVWDEESRTSNSFEGFGWEYPHRVNGSLNIEVSLDVVGIIHKHVGAYRAFNADPDEGHADWEKPILFIYSLIEEQLDFGGIYFGARRLCADRSSTDEYLRVHPPWTAEDTERLHAGLPPVVDHNQGSLDV